MGADWVDADRVDAGGVHRTARLRPGGARPRDCRAIVSDSAGADWPLEFPASAWELRRCAPEVDDGTSLHMSLDRAEINDAIGSIGSVMQTSFEIGPGVLETRPWLSLWMSQPRRRHQLCRIFEAALRLCGLQIRESENVFTVTDLRKTPS